MPLQVSQHEQIRFIIWQQQAIELKQWPTRSVARNSRPGGASTYAEVLEFQFALEAKQLCN